MKFLIDNWYLVLAALVSGGMLLWGSAGRGRSGGVGSAEAVRLINREKGVVIEVGARNLPLAALSTSSEGHKQLPSNKALPLVVVCQSGARAARAAGILQKAGYEKAVVLQGGLKAWREAGLPVEKSNA